MTDTVSYLHDSIKHGKRILIEGANATMLDIDFGMQSGDLKDRLVCLVDFLFS